MLIPLMLKSRDSTGKWTGREESTTQIIMMKRVASDDRPRHSDATGNGQDR